jgi:hypothetical protein
MGFLVKARCRYSYMGEAGNTICGKVQAIWESHVHPFYFYREMRLHTKASTEGGALTQRWFYAERWFHKGMLLLTGSLTQKYFQPKDAFTQAGALYSDAFTQVFLHVNSSTVLSALRTHSFTLRFLYTQALWHSVAGTFTCKYFYTAVFILRAFSLHTRMLCHRDAFDHTCSYTDIFTRGHLCTEKCLFLHTNVFTERWSYTEQFDTETKTNRGAFTKECMCTKGFLATGIFTQTYYRIISCGGHAYGAKSSASICKITV